MGLRVGIELAGEGLLRWRSGGRLLPACKAPLARCHPWRSHGWNGAQPSTPGPRQSGGRLLRCERRRKPGKGRRDHRGARRVPRFLYYRNRWDSCERATGRAYELGQKSLITGLDAVCGRNGGGEGTVGFHVSRNLSKSGIALEQTHNTTPQHVAVSTIFSHILKPLRTRYNCNSFLLCGTTASFNSQHSHSLVVGGVAATL